MSKIPVKQLHDPWESFFDRPSLIRPLSERLEDSDDEDFFLSRPRLSLFRRPWTSMDHYKTSRDIAYSKVYCGRDKFEVRIDVRHFPPENLVVKTVDNLLVVEGHHEDKEDKVGLVSRQFTRKFELPQDSEPEGTTCDLTSDGVLMITIPRAVPADSGNATVIPIKQSDKAYSTSMAKSAANGSMKTYTSSTSSSSSTVKSSTKMYGNGETINGYDKQETVEHVETKT